MHFYKVHILTVLAALTIFGCNDGNEDSHHYTPPSKPTRVLETQDILYHMPIGVENTIDFNTYIQTDDQVNASWIQEFTPINNNSLCHSYHLTENSVSLTMDHAGECYYHYTIHDDNTEITSRSILRVVASNSGVNETLRLFSATTQLDGTVSINVFNNDPLLNNYIIDSSSIQVMGYGVAEIDEVNSNVIVYQASQSQTSLGVSRILFSYINPETESVIPAAIDVSINSLLENYAPRAENFRYGDRDSYQEGNETQLDYQFVGVNQKITIDIAPYFTQGYVNAYDQLISMKDDEGEIIKDEQGDQIHYYLDEDEVTSTPVYKPGRYLIDRDKDKVEVVGVYSYDSFVALSTTATPNTSFTFQASREGLHNVTYVLSDGKGAFATGVVSILVGTPSKFKPWQPNLYTNKNRFMAPLTADQADDAGYLYSYVSLENGQLGPNGWGTPAFDYQTAKRICEVRRMRLPKYDELTDLQSTYSTGLYASLDRYNPESSERVKPVNWPTSTYFWTLAEEGNSMTNVVSLANFSANSVGITSFYPEYYGLICISPGRIASTRIVKNNSQPAFLDDYNEVEVQVTNYQGQPLVGEFVQPLLGDDLVLKSGQITQTDSDGKIKFYIGSNNGQQNISVRFASYDDMKVQEGLRYQAIGGPYGKNFGQKICFYPTLEAMASSRVCNQGLNIVRDNYYRHSIVGDRKYFWRIWGLNVIGYSTLADAASRHNGRVSFRLNSAFPEENNFFYDLRYYWGLRNGRLNAYSSMKDFANNENIRRSIPVNTQLLNNDFGVRSLIYDSIEHKYVFRRYNNELWVYDNLEDLLIAKEPEKKLAYYYSSTAFIQHEKFFVFN